MKPFHCLIYIFYLLLLIILLPLSINAAENSGENPRLPLAMEVFLKKPGQHRYELHVHLTNISDEPVNVDVRDLPWNPTDGPTWLAAFRLDDQHSPIKQDVPLGRFGSRMVRLLPGESIQNRIALTLSLFDPACGY